MRRQEAERLPCDPVTVATYVVLAEVTIRGSSLNRDFGLQIGYHQYMTC
jgi:hypothetical protein